MSDSAYARKSSAVEPAYVNLYSVQKGAGWPEQAFVTLWMFIIYLPLDQFSPLRYLCILGFLAIMVHDYKRLMPLLLKCWPLYILAILGLISMGWSPYPSQAMRQGVLLFLSAFVIVVIAGRLTTRQTLRAVMFAGMLTTIIVAPNWATFQYGGEYYGSKNYFALHMLFCMLLSLIAALDDKEAAPIRLLALPFIPVCFLFIVLAESATALVFAVLGGAGLVAIKLFWSPASKVQGLPFLVILLGLIAALIGAIVVLNLPQNSFVEWFLDLVGKDPTLTGRTALWEGARLAAQERPWLGVGLEGFWQYDTGAAQTLNINDFKPVGTKLTFHSAYWEVRVHLGYIGLALFVTYLTWTSLRMLLLWLRDGSLLNSALLVLLAVNLTMSFTESSLWQTFTTPVFIQGLAGIAAFRLYDPKLEGRARIVSRS